METTLQKIFQIHGIENADKTYPGLLKIVRQAQKKIKTAHNESFTSGYLCAAQVLAIAFGEQTLAEQVLKESGIPKGTFLKMQKLTGYYNRHMNKIIKEAFRK